MKISIPQFGAERHTNETKIGNMNDVTQMFSKPLKPEPTPERFNLNLFEKLDLKGIEDWSEAEQAVMHELMTEFQHLFTLSDFEDVLHWSNTK